MLLMVLKAKLSAFFKKHALKLVAACAAVCAGGAFLWWWKTRNSKEDDCEYFEFDEINDAAAL